MQSPNATAILRAIFFSLAIVTIVALATLPISAGTKIIHRWVLTGEAMPKLDNILVIAVVENYLIRQELEDEMERLLAKSGVTGVKSHMVLPPRNELVEGELKQRIMDGNFDGVLVIRPKSERTETKETITSVAGSPFVPAPGYYQLWPYWHMAVVQAHTTSSHFEENTIVSAEFNLYYGKEEKLLWSGETDTVYCKDFEKLGKDYAKTLVKQLKKDRVIGNE